MKPRSSARGLFIACTAVFIVILGLLLSHRSDTPVFFGRYSSPLTAVIVSLIGLYGLVTCLYVYGWRSVGQAYLFVAGNLLSLVILLVGVNVAAHALSYYTGTSLAA